MEIDKKTSLKISWIQFTSAIVIIFDHCFDYIDYEHAEKGIFESIIYFLSRMLNKGLPYCAMAVFFFLSSFLLYKDWNEKKDLKTWYIKRIKSRFKSIIIPYLLWNLIWTVLFLGVGLLDKSNLTNITGNPEIKDLINGILFAKYNEVFWFMKTLIIYIIISPLIGILITKLNYLTLVLGFGLSVIPNLFTGELLIFANFYNLFFWFLGTYLSINYASVNNKIRSMIHNKKDLFDYLTLIVSLVLITYIQGSDIKQRVSYFVRLLLNCTVLISSIIGSTCFYDIVSHFLGKKTVKWYTKTSFLIYAIHKPVEQVFNKVVAKLFAASLGAHLLNLFGGTLFTLTVVLVTIYVMGKIVPKTTLILNGGRKIFD